MVVRIPRSTSLAARICFIKRINKTAGMPFARLLRNHPTMSSPNGLFCLMDARTVFAVNRAVLGLRGSGTENRSTGNKNEANPDRTPGYEAE